MTGRLADQLRTAFEQASVFIEPRPQLASRVRASARSRRRTRTAVVAAATAVVLLAAGSGVLLANSHAGHHGKPAAQVRLRHPIRIPAAFSMQMAVGGRHLYVATQMPDRLAAYDLATGKLIRRIMLPTGLATLRVGPGGLVWLGFGPVGLAKPARVWLLSADLLRRSAGPVEDAQTIVPTGRTTAWTVSPRGLVALALPSPGNPGRGTQRVEPGTGLGPRTNVEVAGPAEAVGGNVAVEVSGKAFIGGLVIAGHPAIRFGGGKQTQIYRMTSGGDSLWAVTIPRYDVAFPTYGQLIRLNAQLKPTTPASVTTDNPAFATIGGIAYEGGALWVWTGSTGLYCVAADRVTQLPYFGWPDVVISGTAYFATVQGDNQGWLITSKPVPAACR
jgi:hypothetical protein